MTFEARDPDFAARVRNSFSRQTFLATLGAALTEVAPGRCTIVMPARPDLCQQHGYIHAGVTTTLADTAAGYAAFSLMPADSSVLTVELKINLLAPARGERLEARGVVEKAGRTLTVVRADVTGHGDGGTTPIATLLATMMCLHGTSDLAAGGR
ncbi:PaaI family thioesterase [Azospirillum sp. ST 5-10]|uniref:PaaI family thioesterase n=1 Tax=unclassified Azospirillum TaxID=2630922 RepID=UPI003F4A273E